MKTIFNGNNILLKWYFTDAITGTDFSFDNADTRVVLYSHNYRRELNHSIEGNIIQSTIPNHLPIGIYSLECTYWVGIGAKRANVVIHEAFQVTRNTGALVEHELKFYSVAMPIFTTKIATVEYITEKRYKELEASQSLGKRTLYVVTTESGVETMYLYNKPLGGESYLADEEDITLAEKIEEVENEYGDVVEKTTKVYKFKDRDTSKGMGYVILRTDKPILEQMIQENTIYEIRYDFDLNGEEITIPKDCVLDFKGGSFSNGTIIGNNTAINASLIQIFGLDIELQGKWNISEWYPEWYGAKGDGVTDDGAAIQKLDGLTIKFAAKTYAFRNVVFKAFTSLIGSGKGTVEADKGTEGNKTVLKQLDGSSGDFITMQDWYQGNITNLAIIGGSDIKEVNYQQALLKIKTTKEFSDNLNVQGYYYRDSSWCSNIENIVVENSLYNGISYLYSRDIDNGIECDYNWIINTSNVWVQRCYRFCIFNNSTDNRFSNIHTSFGLLGNIFEEGGANVWVNLKCDGQSGYKALDYIKERYTFDTEEEYYQKLMTEKVGANVILNDASNINFVNLDIQSGEYCGIKLFGASLCNLTMSINNCGQGVSDKKYIKYSPGIYINSAVSNEINARIYRFASQYQSINIIDKEFLGTTISNNVINIVEGNQTIYGRQNSVVNVISRLQEYNVVNVDYIDATFKTYPHLYRLHTLSDFWYNNRFSSSGERVDNLLYEGERGIRLSTTSGREVLNTVGIGFKFKKNHIYLCTALQKIEGVEHIVSSPESRSGAYFNIIANVNGGKSPDVIKYQMIPEDNDVDLTNPVLTYQFVQFTDDSYDDIIDGHIRMYLINDLATVSVSNVNVYDLTQDLRVYSLLNNRVENFVKYLFSYTNFDKGNNAFRNLDVRFPKEFITGCGHLNDAISRNINGEMFYDIDSKKPYFRNDDKWLDGDGVESKYDRLLSAHSTIELENLNRYNWENTGVTSDGFSKVYDENSIVEGTYSYSIPANFSRTGILSWNPLNVEAGHWYMVCVTERAEEDYTLNSYENAVYVLATLGAKSLLHKYRYETNVKTDSNFIASFIYYVSQDDINAAGTNQIEFKAVSISKKAYKISCFNVYDLTKYIGDINLTSHSEFTTLREALFQYTNNFNGDNYYNNLQVKLPRKYIVNSMPEAKYNTKTSRINVWNGLEWLDADGNPNSIKRSGTTAERPVPNNIGFTYFDTTLGKPIYAKTISVTDDETNVIWVDSTGIEV